jgi:hypothetical protein
MLERFAQVLADIRKLSDGLTVGSPERHAVMYCKRTAEEALSSALDVAEQCIFTAREMRRVVAEVRDSAESK